MIITKTNRTKLSQTISIHNPYIYWWSTSKCQLYHHISLYSKEDSPQILIYLYTCNGTQLEYETDKTYIHVFETDSQFPIHGNR